MSWSNHWKKEGLKVFKVFEEKLVFRDGILDKRSSRYYNLKLERGVFKVIKGKKISFQILHLLKKQNVDFSFNLCAEESTDIDVFSYFMPIEEEDVSFSSRMTLSLDKKSRLSYTSLVDGRIKSCNFLEVGLEEKSTFENFYFFKGEGDFKTDLRIALRGLEAKNRTYALWDLKREGRAYFNVTADHQGDNSDSFKLFKGVLRDKSRSYLEGTIKVQENLHGVESSQLNKNLILAPLARASSKPNLQVLSSDVKVSHGAFCSNFKEDDLFYLKSKGILEEDAKKLLKDGFMNEIIAAIKNKDVKKEIQTRWISV